MEYLEIIKLSNDIMITLLEQNYKYKALFNDVVNNDLRQVWFLIVFVTIPILLFLLKIIKDC